MEVPENINQVTLDMGSSLKVWVAVANKKIENLQKKVEKCANSAFFFVFLHSAKFLKHFSKSTAQLLPRDLLSFNINMLYGVQLWVQLGCRGCNWGAVDCVKKWTAPTIYDY